MVSRCGIRLWVALLPALTAMPLLAAAQTSEGRIERAKEFAQMLAAASVQASHTAAVCANVPPSPETGGTIAVPQEMRGQLWRGGPDVRWLREQAGVFEYGFRTVVDQLSKINAGTAGQLRNEFEQASTGGGTPGKGPGLETAELEKLRSEPEIASFYCAGLRGMVEEMGVLLSAVPREDATSAR